MPQVSVQKTARTSGTRPPQHPQRKKVGHTWLERPSPAGNKNSQGGLASVFRGCLITTRVPTLFRVLCEKGGRETLTQSPISRSAHFFLDALLQPRYSLIRYIICKIRMILDNLTQAVPPAALQMS
jgi:hypothetical protein